MVELLRRLFTVRHAYSDPFQAMRARMLLPFSLVTGFVLVVINILTAVDVIGQRNERIQNYALIILPIAWGFALITAYLVQHGRINLGTALVGAVLVAYNLADVLFSGTMTTGIIFPMLLIYFSLSFGVRGTVGAYLYAICALVVMVFIRSEGRFGTDQIDNLSSIVFYSSVNLTVTGMLLWLFAGNLQQTLRQSARLVTQTRATATVGQALSRILNLDELLTEAVDLIRDRFALYHVQIFLVDPARSYVKSGGQHRRHR